MFVKAWLVYGGYVTMVMWSYSRGIEDLLTWFGN